MIFLNEGFQIFSRLSIQDLICNKENLKVDPASTGSQCRFFSIGVM